MIVLLVTVVISSLQVLFCGSVKVDSTVSAELIIKQTAVINKEKMISTDFKDNLRPNENF